MATSLNGGPAIVTHTLILKAWFSMAVLNAIGHQRCLPIDQHVLLARLGHLIERTVLFVQRR